jgi:hypothetical protein
MITAWHINRLKAMPLSEVVLRLYRKIRAKVWFFALPHIKTFEKLFSLITVANVSSLVKSFSI